MVVGLLISVQLEMCGRVIGELFIIVQLISLDGVIN